MIREPGYALRVKTGAAWRRYERVRLLISVGQPYHEGAKLKAVVEWISRNPSIREVHVSVNDFLQRHNLIAAGMPEDGAGEVALAEGALWIARNQNTLDAIGDARLCLTRWCDWLGRADVAAARAAIDAYATLDPQFADSIETDAQALAERRSRRGEAVPDGLVGHSRAYVREELAVFAVQAAALPAAEIYPGSNLAAAAYLVGKALPPAIRPLAARHFTRVDFARLAGPVRAPQPTLA